MQFGLFVKNITFVKFFISQLTFQTSFKYNIVRIDYRLYKLVLRADIINYLYSN